MPASDASASGIHSVPALHRRARAALPALICAATLLTLTACASQGDTPTLPAGSFPHTSKWDQQTWVVTALNGNDLAASGPRPTLKIQEGVASGTDGCNGYRRPLKPASDVPSALRFDEPGISTKMACPGPGDAISRDWNAAMTATRSVRTEPKRLTLVDQSGNVIARLEPQPKDEASR